MEPMNATQTHSKVRVTASLSAPVFVAGDEVSGKMEMECKADKGLGIDTMMVELVAVQELTSRDHSATSTFMAAKRIFQGPGLPPSNAVFAHPQPGAPPIPRQYHQARKGCTTFFFNFPLPQSSPNSIDFGNGLARISYEIRCTVAVFWKGERTIVRYNKEVIVTECLLESRLPREPSTLVAEGGKMVVQAQVVGGMGVTGRPTCVELQVKNHSQKKTSGLTLTLTRTLHLPTVGSSSNPFQIEDTVVTVPFRGNEYTIAPGVEGVANLVFDVPRNARGVKGGTREKTDDGGHQHIEAIFYVSTAITVTIGMGVGSKDIKIEVPIQILHPLAVPENQFDAYQGAPAPYAPEYAHLPLEPPRPQYALPPSSSGPPSPASYGTPPLQYQHTAALPQVVPYMPQLSPAPIYAYQQHYVPPPLPYSPIPIGDQAYYFPPPPPVPVVDYTGRPTSAVPMTSYSHPHTNPLAIPSLPPVTLHATGNNAPIAAVTGETEEGKGERASRISLHLKQSSRNRSASPTSHRYRMTGLPISNAPPAPSAVWADPAPSQPLKLSLPEPEIRSPRPMPSPKASYHDEVVASPGQSGRVAALERMVAEEERRKSIDVEAIKSQAEPMSQPRVPSPELTAEELNEVLEKALPPPPALPTKSEREGTSKRPLSNLFKQSAAVGEPTSAIREGEIVQKLWASETPIVKQRKEPEPITVLANLPKRAKQSKDDKAPTAAKDDQLADVPPKTASKPATTLIESPGVGLTALENRLLREVGTRKPPAAVLQQLQAMDEITSAAIKEKTYARKKLGVDPHVKPMEQSEAATVAPSEDKEAAIHVLLNRRRRKSYDVDKYTKEGKAEDTQSLSKQEEEGLRMRKAAKGRVAAWLGDAQEADPPPLSETRILEQASTEDTPAVAEIKKLVEEITSNTEVVHSESNGDTKPTTKPPVDPSKIQLPGRRSSGFLPMSRASVLHSQPPLPTRTQDIDVGLKLKPNPAFAALAAPEGRKYDVRSARGGRGGKVTSVAALWAEKVKTVETSSSSAPKNGVPLPMMVKLGQERVKLTTPTSPTLPNNKKDPLGRVTAATSPKNDKLEKVAPEVDKAIPLFKPAITPARSAPANLVTKGASVPAKLSSSIAKPTLSSTASLARPQPVKSPTPAPPDPKSPVTARPLKYIKPTNLPVSVSEPGIAARTSASKPPSFGQAKIKDLIAKYQGGT